MGNKPHKYIVKNNEQSIEEIVPKPISPAGKVVLITGGAGGFGKAFATKFLSQNCKVCLCDLNAESGKDLADELGKQFRCDDVMFVHCDITDEVSFKEAFSECKRKYGGLDIVINNAGIYNEADFNVNIDVNLKGTIRGSELALENMSKTNGHEGGVIVNVASIAAIRTVECMPFYSAAKSGIIHYSRAIGNQFHNSYTGVTVLCLCPSLVETSFITQTTFYSAQSETAVKSRQGKIELLKPEEVADALITQIQDSKSGSVMVLEKNKKPYYVQTSI